MTNIPFLTGKNRMIKNIILGLIAAVLTGIITNLSKIVPEQYIWAIPLLQTVLMALASFVEKYNKENKKIKEKQNKETETETKE